MQTTLKEMGHPQPPTPIQTDNTTLTGFVKKSLHQKATKSVDMTFYCMLDPSDQEAILILLVHKEG